jgi:molybdopterin-containing oxidoreductase family membrane subunit
MRIEIARRNLAIPLGAAWLAALAIGLVGVAQRLLSGHELAGYTSSVPWGLWVAAYVYFVGLSVGVFLCIAAASVFGLQRLRPFTKLGLFASFVLLLAGLVTIWLDLGHLTRFYRVYTDGNPSSMMAWMVWGYTGYAALLLATLWLVMRAEFVQRSSEPGLAGRLAALLTLGRRDLSAAAIEADRRAVRILFMAGIPLVVAVMGGSGALFGVVGARHFWNAPLMPVLFITAALTSGTALMAVMIAALAPDRGSPQHRDTVHFLGRLVLGLVAFYIVLLWAEYSITLYANIPSASAPAYQVLGGPYPWVFWVFQVALGAVVPIILLTAWPRSVISVGLASFLVAGSFMATRLNIVIPGLVEPQLVGLDTAYVDSRLSFHYFPSVMEWLVLVFVGSFAVGLFYAGYRLLPLVGGRREVLP